MPDPHSSLNPQERELITSLLAGTRRQLSAAACSLALVEGTQLRFVAADGAGAEEVIGLLLPLERGIAGWVTSSGQAIAVSDVHTDQRFDRQAAEQTGYVPRSILAVPVEDDDGPIGVLEVLDRTPAPDDLAVAGQVARQLSLVRSITASGSEEGSDQDDPDSVRVIDLARQLVRTGPEHRRLAARLMAALLPE